MYSLSREQNPKRQSWRKPFPSLARFFCWDLEFFLINPERTYRCRECSMDEMRALLRRIRPKFTGKDLGFLDEQIVIPSPWMVVCRADRLCGSISRIYTLPRVADHYLPGFSDAAPETADDARAKRVWENIDGTDGQWRMFRHRQWLNFDLLRPDMRGAS